MATAHRETRNRTVLLICIHAIVLLCVRHDVMEEIFYEWIYGWQGPAKIKRTRMTGWHYNNHRLGLLGGDQVV